jgi:poly(hydroxyalkanoate) depolymerase family esterase
MRALGLIAIFVIGCGTRGGGPDAGAGGGGSGGAGGFGDGGPGYGDDGGTLAGSVVTGTFTSAQGARDYRLYIPSRYRPGTPLPLIVYLHGCTQSVDSAARATRLDALAEEETLFAAYPIEPTSANPLGCWNWFSASDQVRGQGEPALIDGIAGQIAGSFSVDGKRVWIVGASAGAAMSVIMGATYPDRYAAIGVVAGCEYQGAPCGATGGPDPLAQGQAAYQAMGPRARIVPAIVFQGDADVVVAPVNADQVVQQWLATDDWADDGKHDGSIATTPSLSDSGMVPNGRSWDRTRYAAGGGAIVVERWTIHGAGHAWPGGAAGEAFTDPGGPDATRASYDFFAAHPMP